MVRKSGVNGTKREAESKRRIRAAARDARARAHGWQAGGAGPRLPVELLVVQPRHRLSVLPPRAAVDAERRQDRLEVRGDGGVQLRAGGLALAGTLSTHSAEGLRADGPAQVL
jgi:hypothetical protein